MILEYIDLWHKDPNAPMPDFKLTSGQSHMLTAFISEGKWKFEKVRQLKKAQYKKERYLKKNVVKMTTDELVAVQDEIKNLSDEFDAYHADWKGAKVRLVKLAKTFTPNVATQTHIEIPQAEASAQPTEEHASTADENQVAEENGSTRADDCIPATDDIAKATTSVTLEEQARPAEASTAEPEESEPTRATALVAPEETEPISSAPPAPTTSTVLPFASEAKKTKAAERAAVKKRKASTSSQSSAPKKMKKLTSSFENLIDAIPVSSMPSKELIPFGVDYVIPSGSDEDVPSATSCWESLQKLKKFYASPRSICAETSNEREGSVSSYP